MLFHHTCIYISETSANRVGRLLLEMKVPVSSVLFHQIAIQWRWKHVRY